MDTFMMVTPGKIHSEKQLSYRSPYTEGVETTALQKQCPLHHP